MTIKELYEEVRDGRIISDIELQREIVYNAEKQKLVIDSLLNDIPLPAFYLWRNDDGILEVLDGKQRIEAIKKFKENDLQYEGKIWMQTDATRQKKIDETELQIIVCEGSEELKREIFRRINTLGVPLSEYEVLNGLFNGEYLRGLTAYVNGDKDVRKILKANSRGNNQLTVLRLLMILEGKQRKDIHEYVELRQDVSFETDQQRIRPHIRFIASVFDKYSHLETLFRLAIKYRKDISIWKDHKSEINSRLQRFLKSSDAKLVPNIAKEIEDIIQTVVNGISVDNKRLFTLDDKRELLKQRQCRDGKYQCLDCKQWFFEDELQVDHIMPWSKGGRTELSNARLLCRACNAKKGNSII